MRSITAVCTGSVITASVWILDANVALGAPGGGTDDFGGGGGGGGGYSGGGGGSSGGFSGGGGSRRTSGGSDSTSGTGSSGDVDPGAMWALLIVVGLIAVAVYLFKQQHLKTAPAGGASYRSAGRPGRPARPSRRASGASRAERRERQRQVELAAEEARTQDEAFAPETVKTAAADLHKAIVAAWTARDRETLRTLLTDDLFAEWNLRLDDFDRKGWHNITELQGDPAVEYLGLVNRADDADDRVVVRILAYLRDYVVDGSGQRINRKDEDDDLTTLAEYWTLGKRDGRWTLLSTEQDAEGGHHITSAVIASPAGDERRLRDEAATDLGVATAVPDHMVGELADVDLTFQFEGGARTAALDIANVDGRFDPQVLEAAVRRVVDAWAQAVDGDDDALEAVSTPRALADLLYPGDPSRQTRLVVRGPLVQKVSITGVDPDARPAAMSVEAEVIGRRYLQDRNTTAVLEGDKDKPVRFTERWTLTLDGSDDTPWRIADATATPARPTTV